MCGARVCGAGGACVCVVLSVCVWCVLVLDAYLMSGETAGYVFHTEQEEQSCVCACVCACVRVCVRHGKIHRFIGASASKITMRLPRSRQCAPDTM